MNFKPLGARYFVEPAEEKKVTASGIVLPDTAEKGEVLKGAILAVGTGKRTDKGETITLSLKVGDTVMFEKGYRSKEVEVDGKKGLIVEEEDILAVLE
jgi:chaperonin GroES